MIQSSLQAIVMKMYECVCFFLRQDVVALVAECNSEGSQCFRTKRDIKMIKFYARSIAQAKVQHPLKPGHDEPIWIAGRDSTSNDFRLTPTHGSHINISTATLRVIISQRSDLRGTASMLIHPSEQAASSPEHVFQHLRKMVPVRVAKTVPARRVTVSEGYISINAGYVLCSARAKVKDRTLLSGEIHSDRTQRIMWNG